MTSSHLRLQAEFTHTPHWQLMKPCATQTRDILRSPLNCTGFPQCHGFPGKPLPEEGKTYNYFLSASKALFTVADKVTFTLDSLKGNYIKSLYKSYENSLDKEVYDRS